MSRRGFTLVELMVSMSIVSLLVVVLVSITGQTSKTWQYTTGKMEQFRGARNAFETMTTRLSQATLNTYWDYDNPTTPTRYERRSELRFISGPASTLLGNTANRRYTHAIFFHAPLGFTDDTTAGAGSYRGLENLLNVWGYFVEFGDDQYSRPNILPAGEGTPGYVPLRYRFRLMEMMQSSQKMPTYSYTSGVTNNVPSAKTYFGKEWYQPGANTSLSASGAPVHVLAENVVALIILPKLSKQDRADIAKFEPSSATEDALAPNYLYDTSQARSSKYLNSRDQLPPVVQVTMVAIDESSAGRLRFNNGTSDPFHTDSKFSSSANYAQDLNVNPATLPLPGAGADYSSLENTLISLKAGYRIFTTEVPIRAAKWSREQAN